MRRASVGVDVGGTNVRAQTFDSAGAPVGHRFEVPSRAKEGVTAVIEAIVGTVQSALGQESQADVGLALPGHVDDEAGLVRWANNFAYGPEKPGECWIDVPLKKVLCDRLGQRVALINDANAAAYGEYMFGSGRGSASSLVLLTLGTGVGGGVVLGPHSVHGGSERPLLLLGGNKGGVELGMNVVAGGKHGSGDLPYGAIESIIGRDMISERANRRLRRGEKSLLTELCGGDLNLVDPEMISRAAGRGDKVSCRVWKDVGQFLGMAVANMISVFSPEVLAIGGKVSRAAPYFWDEMLESSYDSCVPSLWNDTRIQLAELADDAGLVGAAALVMNG